MVSGILVFMSHSFFLHTGFLISCVLDSVPDPPDSSVFFWLPLVNEVFLTLVCKQHFINILTLVFSILIQ